MKDVVFLIPARRNSKGFKFKNRKLLDFTLNIIPDEYLSKVYISTDDEELKRRSIDKGINVVHRPDEIAQDKTSMKEVLQHFVNEKKLEDDVDVVVLYLTYPQRTWEDIRTIYDFYVKQDTKSVVCALELIDHPYLCFYEKDDLKGEMVIDHDLYRRQDYPKCFRSSMFVSCYKPSVVSELHNNMFEKDTKFYALDSKKVDVDFEEDFKL